MFWFSAQSVEDLDKDIDVVVAMLSLINVPLWVAFGLAIVNLAVEVARTVVSTLWCMFPGEVLRALTILLILIRPAATVLAFALNLQDTALGWNTRNAATMLAICLILPLFILGVGMAISGKDISDILGLMLPGTVCAMIHYRLPRLRLIGFAASVLALRRRSFARDAQVAMAGLRPPLEVRGGEHVPVQGPALVLCNHYYRPGFPTWWLALGITAAVSAHRAPGADAEIRWVMTAGWTYPTSPWRRRILAPLTRWAFARVAQTYGFVTMPPMPPDPREVEARAWAVLRAVRLARQAAREGGLMGLAPEGQDFSGGLGQPPPGAGEFIALLVQAGLPLLPVGVAEVDGRLRVSFGPPFVPDVPARRAERDRAVAGQVMEAIARQLPHRTDR